MVKEKKNYKYNDWIKPAINKNFKELIERKKQYYS